MTSTTYSDVVSEFLSRGYCPPTEDEFIKTKVRMEEYYGVPNDQSEKIAAATHIVRMLASIQPVQGWR